MRRLSLAAAVVPAALVFALPAPAFAQDAAPASAAPAANAPAANAPAANAMAQLADPATQEQVALMARALGEILLDMPVAPLLDAVEQVAGEPVADVDRDARVADLVGREARDAPAEIAERLPAMMGAMASLAGALEAMAPQLRELASRMPRNDQ